MTIPAPIWNFYCAAGGTVYLQVEIYDQDDAPITQWENDEWRLVLGRPGMAQGFYASEPSDWTTVNAYTKLLTIPNTTTAEYPINNAQFDFKIVTDDAVIVLVNRGTAQTAQLIEEPD